MSHPWILLFLHLPHQASHKVYLLNFSHISSASIISCLLCKHSLLNGLLATNSVPKQSEFPHSSWSDLSKRQIDRGTCSIAPFNPQEKWQAFYLTCEIIYCLPWLTSPSHPSSFCSFDVCTATILNLFLVLRPAPLSFTLRLFSFVALVSSSHTPAPCCLLFTPQFSA